MIEYVDEYRIALPVHLFQFDADQLELVENFGIKEKVAGIKRVEQFLVVFPHYRFQLVYIAHQKQLFSSERFAHIAVVNP